MTDLKRSSWSTTDWQNQWIVMRLIIQRLKQIKSKIVTSFINVIHLKLKPLRFNLEGFFVFITSQAFKAKLYHKPQLLPDNFIQTLITQRISMINDSLKMVNDKYFQ
jgi:hypothetical protein